MPETAHDRCLTVAQVCDRLQLRPAAVRRLIAAHVLQAYRLGHRTIRVPEAALAAYLESCRV